MNFINSRFRNALVISYFLLFVPVFCFSGNLFSSRQYPKPSSIKLLSNANFTELLNSNESLLFKQYILIARSTENFSPIFREQNFVGGFLEKLMEDPGPGIPLFVNSDGSPGKKRVVQDEVLIARLIDGAASKPGTKSLGGSPTLFLEGRICASFVPSVRLEGFITKELPVQYFRGNSTGEFDNTLPGIKKNKLVAGGLAYSITHARLLPIDLGEIWFVPENSSNPLYDRRSLRILLHEITPENLPARIMSLQDDLSKIGIHITFDRFVPVNLFLNSTGFPRRFLPEVYLDGADPSVGLYLSSRIMPRKTGFDKSSGETLSMVEQILRQGFISSARQRLHSFSGSRINDWNLQLGNDDKVFLSYGPGITYADPESFMLIVSPEAAFIDGDELIDRDSFYFKGRAFRRDPLSEAWFSSYETNSPEVNSAIRESLVSYTEDLGLDTFRGRLEWLRALDDFFSAEGLTARKRLSTSLYEQFNNEIRVPGSLSIDSFGECLITPSEATRDSLLGPLQEKSIESRIAGVPVEDFIIAAPDIQEFFPDGTPNDINLKFAYLEYFLRECRAPEYLALREARKLHDTHTLLRIEKETMTGSRLTELVNSQLLKETRALRGRLRNMGKDKSSEYDKLLNEYKWWENPHKEMVAKARSFGPMEEGFLDGILLEINQEFKRSLGLESPLKRAFYCPSHGIKDVKYLARKGGSILINFPFLSMIRRACGIDGVYHILTQEIASWLVSEKDVFLVTDQVMRGLQRVPKFLELSEAMELSGARKSLIRKMIPGTEEIKPHPKSIAND